MSSARAVVTQLDCRRNRDKCRGYESILRQNRISCMSSETAPKPAVDLSLVMDTSHMFIGHEQWRMIDRWPYLQFHISIRCIRQQQSAMCDNFHHSDFQIILIAFVTREHHCLSGNIRKGF